ncbi:RNA modification enzyme MiaB [Pyrodictium occultum]|uniref:RNA modification enzyme MiaB n=1 Tax=Pyrodictium occultum TaxID=2309 RepID=A0A0V8RTG3_PYROC|nr:PUA domain-containing protein [Pyrodictium occultum]KSW11353.1 RNA modification enzyme MiaB [Pyrodictium occultum]
MILRPATREEVLRLRGIADYQFGYPAGDLLIPDDAVVGVSPGTRRIREVYGEEGLLAVLRAHDYLFSLSPRGARRLLSLPEPRLRAWVSPDAMGELRKSIPCRAVRRLDTSLLAGDEVIVLDERGVLLGVGRLRLSPEEILEEECWGEAIRVRKFAEKAVSPGQREVQPG